MGAVAVHALCQGVLGPMHSPARLHLWGLQAQGTVESKRGTSNWQESKQEGDSGSGAARAIGAV
jgi:hypothetical protein